jgi:hypothetical protein
MWERTKEGIPGVVVSAERAAATGDSRSVAFKSYAAEAPNEVETPDDGAPDRSKKGSIERKSFGPRLLVVSVCC